MDRIEALQVARETFPSGPERVAELLGAEVRFGQINVDGWCIETPAGRRLITLNQNAPRTRQRFTLAHEVAHLILGTPPELVCRGGRNLYNPTSPKEKEANQLASELLLPLHEIRPLLTRPIDSRSLTAAAETAVVSEVALALRLVSKAAAFDLRDPVVAKLTDRTVDWRVPFGTPLADDMAAELYSDALRAGGTTRVRSTEDEPVLVCALGNPTYPVLFYHWLPPDYATKETPAETRHRLESELFGSNAPKVRQSLNSYLGAFKPRAKGLTLPAATTAFWERYDSRIRTLFPGGLPRLTIDEYLRVRLREWGLQD